MTPAIRQRGRGAGALGLRTGAIPVLIMLIGTVAGVAVFAPAVWLVVLTDGLFVAALLAAAAGWGSWPTRWLGLSRASAGQQFCVSTALGLGILSTAGLVLGVAGLLNQATAWVLLAAGGVLGLGRLHGARARATPDEPLAAASTGQAARTVALASLALLPLCVPLGVALFGATLPPGVLWAGEVGGYDALEYHLEVPREYFEGGRIRFLPHNVYASFPQQVETLYLLLMHLLGGPYEAAIAAQLLHVSLGVLAVIALTAWARAGWSRIVVALVAGSVPWMAYLGCLAYVEVGVLFFAAVAAGLAAQRVTADEFAGWRIALLTGMCAGLAGGCKYTAVVLVALALGVCWGVAMEGGLRARLRRLASYALGAAIALSPWLIRNAAFTGNPVYPFGYQWFGGADWSIEQDEQWARGHTLLEESDTVLGRATIGIDELFGSQMFGVAVWLLSVAGLALRPTRRNWLLAGWGLLVIGTWAVFTHMPGRFAVPVVVPLSLILGQAVLPGNGWRRRTVGTFVVAAAVGALLNDLKIVRLVSAESQRWQQRAGVPLKWMVDKTHVRRDADPVNMAINDASAYVWLVGDAAVFYVTPRMHYTVVFNRDPWLKFAATATPEECVAWLRTRNVTHVVFSWAEIERLRGTYGYPPIVTSAWVAGLEPAGLRCVHMAEDTAGRMISEIYEVEPE